MKGFELFSVPLVITEGRGRSGQGGGGEDKVQDDRIEGRLSLRGVEMEVRGREFIRRARLFGPNWRGQQVIDREEQS